MPGSCRANRRAPSWSAGMTDQLLMGFVSHQAPSHQILLSRPRLPRHQGEAVRGFLLVLSVHDEDPKAQYPDGHSRAGVDPDHASTLSDRKEAARVSMVGGAMEQRPVVTTVLAIDIGGTKLAAGIVEADGRILFRGEVPTVAA